MASLLLKCTQFLQFPGNNALVTLASVERLLLDLVAPGSNHGFSPIFVLEFVPLWPYHLRGIKCDNKLNARLLLNRKQGKPVNPNFHFKIVSYKYLQNIEYMHMYPFDRSILTWNWKENFLFSMEYSKAEG